MNRVVHAACIVVALTQAAYGAKPPAAKTEAAFTESFGEEKADFGPTGTNPFFILQPGFTTEYAGEEDGKKVVLKITVLDETRKVDGVETRVVEERESANGDEIEVSRNYFAISKRTNSVYYFGEDSKTFKQGKMTGQEGSWEAGVGGARYGMMIPGVPLLGAHFYQEIAPKVAMDRAVIVGIDDKVETPAGSFTGCLKTDETTPLEPGHAESKYYAPGVGLVQDGLLRLVRQSGAEAAKKP